MTADHHPAPDERDTPAAAPAAPDPARLAALRRLGAICLRFLASPRLGTDALAGEDTVPGAEALPLVE